MNERVAEAKALLKQAGFDAQHPLTFELFYNKYDLHEKTAIALSSEWKKWLGADVKLRTMEWKTYWMHDVKGISCCLASRGMRPTTKHQHF